MIDKQVYLSLSSTAPAVVDVCTCDVAIVGTVTYNVRHLPYDHGKAMTPSGHFPSLRSSQVAVLKIVYGSTKAVPDDVI